MLIKPLQTSKAFVPLSGLIKKIKKIMKINPRSQNVMSYNFYFSEVKNAVVENRHYDIFMKINVKPNDTYCR